MWRSIPGGTWVHSSPGFDIGTGTGHRPGECRSSPEEDAPRPLRPRSRRPSATWPSWSRTARSRSRASAWSRAWRTPGPIRRRPGIARQLVDEMSKAGVEHASKLLASPQFSMVIVRMTIPIGVTPKDRLDVQVEVPPACGTKSLAGGYLMATRLREVMVAGGAPRTGPELAIAQGPVMIGTAKKPNDPKVGRVLGGGRVKKDFPYTLVIKENREEHPDGHDPRDGGQ